MGLTSALIQQIHHMTGIPEMNLRRWQRMITKDPEWRPWNNYHGHRHCIFTPLQEIAIVLFIKTNFLNQRLVFTDDNFREIAMTTFLQTHTF
jgi:hypothetical protein